MSGELAGERGSLALMTRGWVLDDRARRVVSGGRGCRLVAVELHEVVGGGYQSPL